MPLDWFFRPGVKLDFRHLPDGYVVTAEDIERELARIDYSLRPFDIVVVNTSAAAKFGTEHYAESGCGVGREATLFSAKGVRVVGTDAWGGMRHTSMWQNGTPATVTPRLSGKDTKPDARSSIARSRSFGISNSSLRTDSR